MPWTSEASFGMGRPGLTSQLLRQVIAPVKAAHEDVFEQHPGHEGDTDAAGERDPEAARVLGKPVSQIGTQHIERAVGEVDHAEDAEDEREAARDQEQHEAVLNAVQQLNAKGEKIHEAAVQTPFRDEKEPASRPAPGCRDRAA